MARFHHTVTVTALDRAWFEECAALTPDVVEATRTDSEGALLEAGEKVPGVRLVRGRHPRTGARCTVTSAPSSTAPGSAPGAPPATMTVRIREWRRSTGIAVEHPSSGSLCDGASAGEWTRPARGGTRRPARTSRPPTHCGRSTSRP